MSIPYKIVIQFYQDITMFSIGLILPRDERNYINMNELIRMAYRPNLLRFTESTIEGTNEETGMGVNDYDLHVVEKDGRKMFEISCNLYEDDPVNFFPPCYVSPEEFKEILEIWMREEEKFYKDPEKYKGEMLRNGAVLLGPHNVKNIDDLKQKIAKAKNGVVSDWREAKSDKLDMLPREFSDKGKADESNRPWWQFWK